MPAQSAQPAQRTLTLNLFLHHAGHHEASWRHPSTHPEELFGPDYYVRLAQRAEAAKLDAVFFADGPALYSGAIEHNAVGALEPILTLATIAAHTERIGLIATASTTYYEPYNLARLFATLDHLSGGRAGWNVVTTSSAEAAANFGLDAHPDPAVRYARAEEFLQAATRLWDSWEADAVLVDREAGRYADPARIHPAAFAGEHLSVGGALNVARTPQGRPVLVQAGASNAGRDFAARWAEAIFTAHQRLEDAQAFYADIKSGALRHGRDPEQVKVLPGISPFLGSTEAEARALEQELNELTVPALGLRQLSGQTGADLSGLDLDAPVPLELFADAGDVTDNSRSRFQVVAGIVQRERPTLRGLLHRLAGARGHRVVAGTPEQVADTIEEWFTSGAADGFNVMPPALPAGLDAFVDHVVPILQARGLFRTEYEGSTLRSHLGLDVPENRYTAARRTADEVPDDAVVVVVGNPRRGSRTRAAAELAARRVAEHHGLSGAVRTIELADLAPELLTDGPGVTEALRTLASARFAVVATPVYKASYTGLLKAFLDSYGPLGLDGVATVPLVVSASPEHARAGDDHLRPLLVELGATVPQTSLALLESDLPDVQAQVDEWIVRWPAVTSAGAEALATGAAR
jgi:FMN-dependent oxidoreductase (nitrilotriacetate monooxygenase family)